MFWKSWIKIDDVPPKSKSYLENRKSYEFLNAIFEFRLKDLFWKSWIKIEDASQKSKNYLENRKSYEFSDAIFGFPGILDICFDIRCGLN